jgi:hypothetical protein
VLIANDTSPSDVSHLASYISLVTDQSDANVEVDASAWIDYECEIAMHTYSTQRAGLLQTCYQGPTSLFPQSCQA